MRTREIKGDPNICPHCGSDRIGCNDTVEIDSSCIGELRLGIFCLDCSDTYDAIYIPTGRIVVED